MLVIPEKKGEKRQRVRLWSMTAQLKRIPMPVTQCDAAEFLGAYAEVVEYRVGVASRRTLAQRDQPNGGVGRPSFSALTHTGWRHPCLPGHVGWQIDDFGPGDFRDRLGRC